MQNMKDGILRYDVGVEANDFYLVSIEKILKYFNFKGSESYGKRR